MKRIVTVVLVLMLCATCVIVWPGERAYACSCAESSVKEKLEMHTAVFTGEVVNVGRGSLLISGEFEAYTLDVDTAWKGVDAKQMTILISNLGGGSCGTTLTKDQSYLIFAHQDDKDGRLYSSLCSGNLKIEQAGEAINMLGKGTPVSSDDFRGGSGYHNLWMIILYGGGIILLLVLVGGSLWERKKRKV
ncbi:hypothetical protein Q9R46_17180 [Paenibacillus sp. RRE4]|uniref:hypothetical protein n=1 Tax=Paenibacillus sp. RRE4 TaxID=2962587 RepID=UPI002881A006|nr:hypothetical protein [Paenibacillus sp. RRE4]MDT0124396.1 hypothetical protein [Paenibacillus sp. RRE4]